MAQYCDWAAVAVVVALCSPLIATIYHEPRLEPIALCSAISFVAWGASNQHLALLRRTMRFGTIAGIQVSKHPGGSRHRHFHGIRRLWLLGTCAASVTSALCLPVEHGSSAAGDRDFPVVDAEVKSMVRFGLHVVGFSVTYTVVKAVDRIGLSLFYRPDVVGYYQNATTLYENSIFSVLLQLHAVGSASLSKLQSNPAALRQKYETALSSLAFFIMPIAAILSVTAEDVTVLLWAKSGGRPVRF